MDDQISYTPMGHNHGGAALGAHVASSALKKSTFDLNNTSVLWGSLLGDTIVWDVDGNPVEYAMVMVEHTPTTAGLACDVIQWDTLCSCTPIMDFPHVMFAEGYSWRVVAVLLQPSTSGYANEDGSWVAANPEYHSYAAWCPVPNTDTFTIVSDTLGNVLHKINALLVLKRIVDTQE
jgi:hypothetical protein